VKALEPGGCTHQWQLIPFTSARSARCSSGSCFWQRCGWRPAAVFPETNTRWCLFLTVLHLVLFYENRLQDHHVVIPSVLQGLRALVSSRPPALGCAAERCQEGATPGYRLEQHVKQGPAGLPAPARWLCPISSVLLLCPLQMGRREEAALISCPVLAMGQGFPPCPPWGAVYVRGVLSSLWGW